MNPSDSELVTLYLEGNEDALSILFNRHVRSLYRFIYSLVFDSAAADALSQDTFVKVWKSLPSYDHSQKFQTWIFAIAKNTVFDYLRAEGRRFEQQEELFQGLGESDDDSSVKEVAEQQFDRDFLLRSMQYLSEDERMVVLLHYFEDFTLGETAVTVDKNINTVKSLHRRAISKLRKHITE